MGDSYPPLLEFTSNNMSNSSISRQIRMRVMQGRGTRTRVSGLRFLRYLRHLRHLRHLDSRLLEVVEGEEAKERLRIRIEAEGTKEGVIGWIEDIGIRVHEGGRVVRYRSSLEVLTP